jgi:hypothetical protein
VYSGNFVCKRPSVIQTAGLSGSGRIAVGTSLGIMRSPNASPVYQTAPGVSGCVLEGVEAQGMVAFGTTLETSLDQLPRSGGIRRVIIRPAPGTTLKRGLSFHGIGLFSEDSHIEGVRVVKQDSQAIWISNGPGPYRIVNNYLEAASENILVGGDSVRIAGVTPADILIENNTIAKPLAWKAETGWQVKNLLELKNAKRVVIRGNTFDGNWVDGQSGYAILFTPRNQYGDNPWSVVEDVLFERNVLRNISGGLNISGDDSNNISQRTSRITITQNKFLISRAVMGGSGRCAQITRGPQVIVWTQNTCISDGTSFIYTAGGGIVTAITSSVFTGNIFVHNTYGFASDVSPTSALDTIAAYYPEVVWEGNAVGGGSVSRYPAGNMIMTVADFTAAFTNYAEGIINPTGALAGKGVQP